MGCFKEINKKRNNAKKHHFLRLQVMNKGNNIKLIFVLYIQMAKTRNVPNSTRVKMQVVNEEGCSYCQIATRYRYRHTRARMIIKIFQQSVSLTGKPRSG